MDQQRIGKYLASHNTVTLATCGDGRPWAAAVFYAHGADLTLYFKSDPVTRHMQDIIGHGEVAATIQDDGQDWKTIRGLQLIGDCTGVQASESEAADLCYVRKFPFLAAISGQGAEQDLLLARLKSTPYFQLRPRWIRLIDNSLGFGHKTEMAF